ncbi:MAG: type II secretion system F family protein [Actinomycetota bacterium]
MKVWFPRRKGEELEDRAAALRGLAALLRSGLSSRQALVLWHEDAPAPLCPDLERVAHRLMLGEPVPRAIASLGDALGPDAHSLQVVFGMSGMLGGDVARIIDRLAATVETRRASLQSTFAAVAGMTLSARIIAGLPLLCVPLLPASGFSLVDPVGLLLVILGVTLTLAGMRWMEHLTPQPPEIEDGVCSVARAAASALSGGASLQTTLDATARHAPHDVRADMLRARKLTRLGLGWPDALRRSSNPGLVGMSVTLERAVRKGLPAAVGLEAFAAHRDAQAASELDRSVRRAPILMAIPLVACVLPSFLLLGVVPFLRGLAP